MKRMRIVMLAAAVCLLLVFVISYIFIQDKQILSPQDITLTVRAAGQEAELRLWHNYFDGKEYLFLPSFCGESASCHISQGTFAAQAWDGQRLGWSGRLDTLEDGEHTLRLKGADYGVVVMRSANVPALFITTASGSLEYIEAEKGNSESGMYEMVGADGRILASGELNKLKARGNVTFLEDKKPYQMSLSEPADLLGTGELENYILLANRQDQSLLRDRIVYDLAGEMGLAYSPVSIHVDLYINREYRGSYQLSEKVEAAPGRIEIDVSGQEKETGFLAALEFAARAQEDGENYLTTSHNQCVIVRRPKEPTEAQMDYIEAVFQEVEDAAREGSIEDADIDMESFAKKYLVEEISKNLDAMSSSQFFYKDAGSASVLYAGPVWDYDKSLGNPLIEHNRSGNFQEPRGLYAATVQENGSWWYDLYQQPAFRERAVAEYRESALPAIEAMLNGAIDGYRDEIWASAYLDYMRWDPFEDFKYGEELEFETEYQAEIDTIKEFLRLRMEFLNDIWLENRSYDQIVCDPGEGTMYVTELDAVEGRKINEPRDPKLEGYQFDYWIRTDTGERYDFTEEYDGVPFTLEAVYKRLC